MNKEVVLASAGKFCGNILNRKLRAVFVYAPVLFFLSNMLISCNGNGTASQSAAQSARDSLAAAKDTIQQQTNASHALVNRQHKVDQI